METQEQRVHREYWEKWKPTRTFEECENSEDKHNYILRGITYIKCVHCGDAQERGEW